MKIKTNIPPIYLKLILIVIIIAIVGITLIYFYINKGNGTENNNNHTGITVIMNSTVYLNDGDYSIDHVNRIFHNFYKSVAPGDILKINDRIVQTPQYRGFVEQVNTDVTTLIISGSGKDAWPISFWVIGDVEDEYKIGDLIEVTVHITYYNDDQQWNNESWYIYGEFPEESFVEGLYSGGAIILLPSQVKILDED